MVFARSPFPSAPWHAAHWAAAARPRWTAAGSVLIGVVCRGWAAKYAAMSSTPKWIACFA